MNFTINLPTKDALFDERVVVDQIEDKYKNIRYYIKFHCNTLQNLYKHTLEVVLHTFTAIRKNLPAAHLEAYAAVLSAP